jgi:integrase
MARRRGNNEGTVFQDKDGVWWAQLPPDEQGQRPKRRARTQREAQQKLREMQREREQGLNLTAKQPTVEEFAQTWLEEVVKRTCKASTHTNYTNVMRYYVLPHIGQLRLDKLTTQRVQRLFNDLADAGYSPDTVHNAYLRLRGMLTVAVEYRLVAHNVAIAIRLPKTRKSGQRALAVDEVRTFLRAVAGQRLELLYHVLVKLGVRRGEGLGLCWRDLDWEVGTIEITQQVQAPDGKTSITKPKTEGSERTLPLPPRLLERLREHRAVQREERAVLGDAWQEHGLIFPSEVGTPLSPRNVLRHFALAKVRAGLVPGDNDSAEADKAGTVSEDEHEEDRGNGRLRLHDLRHTCATLLGELGVEERVIGAILGHVPATVTARYAHVSLAAMREALELLERALEGEDET